MKIKSFIIGLFFAGLLACGGELEQAEMEKLAEIEVDSLEEVMDVIEIPATKTGDDYLIATHKVGEFEIGGIIPKDTDTYLVKKEEEMIEMEGDAYKNVFYEVIKESKVVVQISPIYDFELDDLTNKIGEITVFSTDYQTAKEIGIGSTIEEFINAYNDYEIWYTYISDMYVIESQSLGVQFILDGNGFSGEMNINTDVVILKPSDFEEDTKIKKIRLIEQ